MALQGMQMGQPGYPQAASGQQSYYPQAPPPMGAPGQPGYYPQMSGGVRQAVQPGGYPGGYPQAPASAPVNEIHVNVKQKEIFIAVVPKGVEGGASFQTTAPSGRKITVVAPLGGRQGLEFQVHA